MNCSAIVLAAGNSTRMGEQKMLLPFNGTTVIQHIVRQLQESGIASIIVVVGRDATPIRRVLQNSTAVIVDNPGYEQGMLTSVRAGIRAQTEESDACLVCLGDQPAIQPTVIGLIISEGQSKALNIVVPEYRGRKGHPLYISRVYWANILSSYDGVGLRGLLVEFEKSVQHLLVDKSWILDDMDYPEDYQRELKRLEAES